MKKFLQSQFSTFHPHVRYPKIFLRFRQKEERRVKNTNKRDFKEKEVKRMTDSKDLSEPLLSGFEEKVEDEDWRASLVAVEVRRFLFQAPIFQASNTYRFLFQAPNTYITPTRTDER